MSQKTDAVSAELTIHRRWPIAVAGVTIQMILGTVYAWSVFKKPFMASHEWTGEQVGFAFTLVILFLGLAAAFGGRFVDKAGARKVATIAAILFGVGTLLTGVADAMGSRFLLYIGYGVIGGIGNGLGYITPIAVLVRWFPDKRGLITGLAVMGFGFGAAIMGQIAPFMIPKTGLATSFYIYGAIYLVVMLVAAQFLRNPPEGWTAPAPAKGKASAPAAPEVDLSGALRMPQFYLLWCVMFINITAGIALISNMSVMAQEKCGVTAIVAGTVVFVTSLFNGIGRIFWAALSDKLGRKMVFMLIIGTQIPLFFILPHISNVVLFSVVACYILACYGGGFSTMPAYVADTFSAKNIGRIYGKVLLAWGAAGIVGPMLMEYIKKTSGDFKMAIFAAGAFLVVGFIMNALYRRPHADVSGNQGVSQ